MTMKDIRTVFFGSTTDSLIVLNALSEWSTSVYRMSIVAVVTQPPRPVGRKQILTPTPVQEWTKGHNIPVLSFPSDPDHPNLYADEQTVVDTLEPLKADLLVTASYGQKIPTKTITDATYGGLNVHPSLLPRWRGADPVPWAIMSGDRQTGVTVLTLTEKFDEGKIIAQKKVPITDNDTTELLRANLFTLGAQLLIEVLPDYFSGKNKGSVQKKSDTPYAKRLTRDDGFEPWEHMKNALKNTQEAARIERKFRALTPWPGLWTRLPSLRSGNGGQATDLRLKILSCHLTHDTYFSLDTVQLEGKKPVLFTQFLAAYPGVFADEKTIR